MYQMELADGEQANGLANLLNMLLSQNLASNPEKQNLARKMNCSIGLYTTDTDQHCTLVFGRDKLNIKNGLVKPVRVQVSANTSHLIDVSQLKVVGGWFPSGFFTKRGWQIIKEILAGRLKVKGLVTHLLTVIRFISLVSIAR
jgi:hypothetical protein